MKQKSPAILTDNKACLKLYFRLVFSLFQVSCVVVMSFPSARKVNLHIVGYVSVLYCLVCNIRSQTHLLRGRIYILDRIVLPLFCLFQNLVNSGNSMFSRLNVKKKYVQWLRVFLLFARLHQCPLVTLYGGCDCGKPGYDPLRFGIIGLRMLYMFSPPFRHCRQASARRLCRAW